jgi:hypothetical protein
MRDSERGHWSVTEGDRSAEEAIPTVFPVPTVLPVNADDAIPTVFPVPPMHRPRADDAIPTIYPVPTVYPMPTVLPVPIAELAEASANSVDVAMEPVPSGPAQSPSEKPRGFLGFAWALVRGTCSVCEWCFGLASLFVFLSVLAAIPILQFLSLGYLLEASGRVARTGKLRTGFIGVRIAARAGALVLGTWLMLLPLRLVSSLWYSAELIEPDGTTARVWGIALTVLTALMLVHLAMAWACGGRLRHFFFPFLNPIWIALRVWRGGFWRETRDAPWTFVESLRLPYYFWLGFRGFWGAFLWLAVPITLIAIGRKVPILGVVGVLGLIVMLLYVPFLQLRFAVENRFRAFFEWRTMRRHFKRAPIAMAFAFFVTLLFAVPLYLLKIEMIPREAAWLPSLVFVVFMFPARVLSGWAFGRSLRRKMPRNFVFRWSARLFMLAVTVLYVVIVYFSQFAAWGGIWSLYEQHAFLLPVPFFSM